ncbi:uncharacterized protein LOC114670417 [Macaca mulatta]
MAQGPGVSILWVLSPPSILMGPRRSCSRNSENLQLRVEARGGITPCALQRSPDTATDHTTISLLDWRGCSHVADPGQSETFHGNSGHEKHPSCLPYCRNIRITSSRAKAPQSVCRNILAISCWATSSTARTPPSQSQDYPSL